MTSFKCPPITNFEANGMAGQAHSGHAPVLKLFNN